MTQRTEERGKDYETVAGGQTDQVMGSTGKAGNYLRTVVVETSTGTIVIKDGSTTILTIPSGTAGNEYRLGIESKTGPFSITTAASTTCVCTGEFRD